MLETKEEIKNWLDEMNIKDYDIFQSNLSEKYLVNVHNDVDIFFKDLTQIPIQFHRVEGSFNCGSNALSTLKGTPYYIKGNFDCSNGMLINLDYMPLEIGGNINVSSNKLTSLKGVQSVVYGAFNCEENYISSLTYAPDIVQEDLYCCNNHITSFDGCPQQVKSIFATGNFIKDYDCLLNKKIEYLEFYHSEEDKIQELKDYYYIVRQNGNPKEFWELQIDFPTFNQYLSKKFLKETLEISLNNDQKNFKNRKHKI